MFITEVASRRALAELSGLHPFFGITLLALLRNNLPVGTPIVFPISHHENEIAAEVLGLIPDSDYFFRVFRVSDLDKHWLHKRKYATSTLQSIRTQSGFSDVLIHAKGTSEWAWQPDYVPHLASLLQSANQIGSRDQRIPAYSLALLQCRNELVQSPTQLINRWRDQNCIHEDIWNALFADDSHQYSDIQVCQDYSLTLSEWVSILGSLPPDISTDEPTPLRHLRVIGLGPCESYELEPSPRLNIILGDNGLGKSFLLDTIWYASTGAWPREPGIPSGQSASKPRIEAAYLNTFGISEQTISIYNAHRSAHEGGWEMRSRSKNGPNVVLYYQIDGTASIYLPRFDRSDPRTSTDQDILHLTVEEIWGGKRVRNRQLINGLISDLESWRANGDRRFNILSDLVGLLSPPADADIGPIRLGKPIRIPLDTRLIPTVEHAYGVVPILVASAGVKKALTLAYLLVWISTEAAAFTSGKKLSWLMLIDELEAHLHPKWQRSVLPALIECVDRLGHTTFRSFEAGAQLFVASHSPLVAASTFDFFDARLDRFFKLDVEAAGQHGHPEVTVSNWDAYNYGSVDQWLTSDLFELRESRSARAEEIVVKAKQLLDAPSVQYEQAVLLHRELVTAIPPDDEFWIRWYGFLQAHDLLKRVVLD